MKPLRDAMTRESEAVTRRDDTPTCNVQASCNEKRGQRGQSQTVEICVAHGENIDLPTMPTLPTEIPFPKISAYIRRTNGFSIGVVGNVGNGSSPSRRMVAGVEISPPTICKGRGVVRSVKGMHTINTVCDARPMSREEAAAYLGTSANTLAGWAARRIGPRYSRSGSRRGKVWYRVADLDAWLESRQQPQGTDA